uniref:TNFR-Cys domain-containing protein n=1 Tax=Sphenodon punctatus TaxID=8508 RepID=A0A8D0HID3_SPHPU
MHLKRFIIILVTQLVHLDAETCEAGEYKIDNKCCPTCNAGFRLIIKQPCTDRKNTVCGCVQGYFCIGGSDCDNCWKHTVSPPGFMVLQPGTEISDTKFVACPPRTFSTAFMSLTCSPWSNCSEQGLVEKNAGTATSDVVCVKSDHRGTTGIAVGILVGIVILIGIGIVKYGIPFCRKARPAMAEAQVKQNIDYAQVPHKGPEPIHPVQETAVNCGELASNV